MLMKALGVLCMIGFAVCMIATFFPSFRKIIRRFFDGT